MDSKDTQKLLKEHRIPSIDVGWLVRPNASAVRRERSKSKAESVAPDVQMDTALLARLRHVCRHLLRHSLPER